MTVPTFPYDIDYYKTAEGKAPFKEWLEALRDVNGRAKIRVRLDRAHLGNLGDHKSVDEGYGLIQGRGIVSISPKRATGLFYFLSEATRAHRSGTLFRQTASYLKDHQRRP